MIQVKFNRDSINSQFKHMLASGRSTLTDTRFKRQFIYACHLQDIIRDIDGDILEYDRDAWVADFQRLLFNEDVHDIVEHNLELYRVQIVLGLCNMADQGQTLMGVPDYEY